jgi:uncharacterized Fe-S cluster protein YjdI
MPLQTHKYTNGKITIVWKPGLCIHSAICFKGLPAVFDPRRKPWIEAGNSSTERIIEQVNACPSGAIGFYYNDEGGTDNVHVPSEG